MHGESETSYLPRAVFGAVNVVGAGATAWLLQGDGLATLSLEIGDSARRLALTACALVCCLRFSFLVIFLLRRRMGWAEAGIVSAYTALIYVVYALLGGPTHAPLDVIDGFALTLFGMGSYLNTGSEFSRKLFKADPANRGKLYTSGLFALSRHINYFGDTLWMSGWALLCRSPWAFLLPLASTLGFLFEHIPALEKHLAAKYGDQFKTYASTTKRFVPWLY